MIRVYDSETALITEFDKAPKLVCSQFAGEDGSVEIYRWCDAEQAIARSLTHDTMIGVHIAYDMAVICREFPHFIPLVWQAYDEDRIRDLGIEKKLMDIKEGNRTERSYALGTLVYDAYGVKLDKEKYRLEFWNLHDQPLDLWPEGAVQYALNDVRWPLRLLQEGIIDGGPDKFRQARHAFWANLMSIWGVRTDPVRVARLRMKLENRYDQAAKILVDQKILRVGGTKKEPKLVQDTKLTRAKMIEACARLGIPVWYTDPSDRFPEGQVQISAERCRDAHDPVLEVVADYGSIRKQLSTDIPNLERGEIHTKYDSLKDSGRMGSGGEDDTSPTGTAFNLTNLARSGGIRECLVPRPGKVFFDSDYDGLEAHTGAQACLWLVGESSLAGILNRNEDWHIHTASGYFEDDYFSRLAVYQAGDNETKDVRQFAKIFNYGCGGGMGMEKAYLHALKELKKEPATRELASRLTRAQSNKLWTVWRTKYSEWPKYFDRTAALTRGGGCQFEQLVSGRIRGVFGKGSYTEMNNGYFQGLGADAAKDAGWHLSRECFDFSRNSILLGSRVVIFGHDSFTGETDPEGAHEVAMRVKEIMEGVSPIWTPDVPLTTTPCLTTCLSKGAKAVYDKNKRLVPWSPDEKMLEELYG